MKKISIYIVLVNALLLLFFFNYNIFNKERILNHGEKILIALAPKDPRSLFQGDYMRLSYAITNDLRFDSMPIKGYCVVELDSNRIASFIRVQENILPKAENEYLIEYHRTQWEVSIGAESYFFEEGKASNFENAKYGCLRVDKKGNSVLEGLYNSELQKIN